MKICVVHGSQRKGNTEKTIEIVKEKLNALGENEFVDFYLPKDLPSFCIGCYQCMDKGSYGGEFCPHRQHTHPIIETMRTSDGIIITSPVYCMAESGQVKAFMDHLGCIYMSHRPMEEMFSKAAFVISTTAGGGTKHAIKPIERTLGFLGIPRIYKCGLTLWAKNWDEMPGEKQSRYTKILSKKANAFYKSMIQEKLPIPMKTRFLFSLFRKLMSSYKDGHKDKEYWREKGWLYGGKPW